MRSIDRVIFNWLLGIVLTVISASSFAYNESLSFHLTQAGTIEAVISGLSDGPECKTEFISPISMVVSGNAVTITSPYTDYFCGLPLPPAPYQVTADLGTLSGPSYQVTWTEGPLVVSAMLVPDALMP